MKKYLLASTCAAALLGGVGAASAADMAVKAAPYMAPTVPAAMWEGGYIGGHFGVARMNSTCSNIGYGDGDYTCGYEYSQHQNVSDTGVIGGVQAGYDWQDRNFVYGVAADWTWTGLGRKEANYSGSYGTKAKVDWLASFRGRAGLAMDNTLLYLTAGLALGGIKAETGDFYGSSCTYYCSNLSKTAIGWVAGAGVEHKFGPNWSAFGEVLYYDLGRHDGSVYNSTYTYQAAFSFEVMTARFGLNYRF